MAGLAATALVSFPGRLVLFLLALARPEGWPDPQRLVSTPPRVERVAFPSDSGRRIVADVYRPGRRGDPARPAPALLLWTPASRDGLANPGVRRAASAFARLGYVTMAGFPEGRQIPHASPADIADARAALEALRRTPGADPGRLIGAGLSYGSGPLLLAVREMPTDRRPSRILVLGGYADLKEVIRFATTGAYAYRSLRGRLEPSPYVREMLGRTLVAWADPADRPLLLAVVEGRRAGVPAELSPGGKRLAALFLNRDPDRFDALYAGLPASVRAQVERLSVTSRPGGLTTPVFILHPRNDRFVPVSEALRLWDMLPPQARAGIVLAPALPHGLPLREREERLQALRSLGAVYRLARSALYPTPLR